MNQATKRIISVVFTIGLCFHFCMLFIYCFPIKINHSKIKGINNLYMNPIFYQNWGLFVPAPNVERKLFVRCKIEGQFTNWKDILSDEIVYHKQNRLLGNEAIVLLFSNSLIHQLNYLNEKPSCITTKNSNNAEFKVLKFEVEQYLKAKYKFKKNSTCELLLVSTNKNDIKAYYFKSLAIN